MRPKLLAGIIALSLVCLTGLAGTIYFVSRILHNVTPEGKAEIDCRSRDAVTSMRGCTAVIQGGKAQGHALTYAYNRRSVLCIDQQRFDQAISDSNKVISLDPGNAPAFHNRGFAYLRMKNFDAALADLTESLKLHPSDPVVWLQRGQAYRGKKDYSHAISDYTHAIQFNSEDGVAYVNRGFSYIENGDPGKALPDCEKAVELRPNDANAYDCRAFTNLLLNKPEEA